MIAAEVREQFSPEPPTEEGYYKARYEHSQEWEIVKVRKSIFKQLLACRFDQEGVFDPHFFDLWSIKINMPGGGSE